MDSTNLLEAELKKLNTHCFSHPIEVDLIFEAGGNEFFIIEGDSLLVDMLTCPDRAIDWTHGGQFLHLLWAIEELINTLLNCGAKFEVVFFDSHIALWKDQPSVLCFRRLLISHLKRNTTQLIVHQLPDWKGKKSPFVQKFLNSNVAFVALSDAEHTPSLHQKLHLRSFYLFCRSHTQCTFISSINVQKGRLIGYIVKQQKTNYKLNKISQSLKRESKAMKKEFESDLNSKIPTDRTANWVEWVTYNACVDLINGTTKEEEKESYIELVKVMIMHSKLISALPLRCRSLQFKTDDSSTIIQQFLNKYFSLCNILLTKQSTIEGASIDKFVDFFDGRLFYSLLLLFKDDKHTVEQLFVDAAVAELYRDWQYINSACGSGLGSSVHPKVTAKGTFYSSERIAETLLYKCDSGVKSIVISQSIGVEGKDYHTTQEAIKFVENKHWHSNKLIEDSIWLTTDKKAGTKQQSIQKVYSFIGEYASSLGLRSYKLARKQVDSSSSQDTERHKAKDANIYSILSNAEELKEIDDINGENERLMTDWKNKKKAIEQLKTQKKTKSIIKLLEDQISADVPLAIKREALVLLLEVYLSHFVKQRTKHSKGNPKFPRLKVNLLRLIHKLLDKHSNDMAVSDKKNIVAALMHMEFYDAASLLATDFGISVSESTEDGHHESSIRFQLVHMGHLLKRKTGGRHDSRVGFKPDAWQKELIDLVDNNASALVIAPTSAGKTFISYYCMKKVMEEYSDGIVVYVAPTKALVNQVSAEVYARFKDECSKLKDGVSIFGIFTRDFRFNPLSCKVLVTVPQCLEILLLSPVHENWSKKIKYVIFDEVHAIAERGSGEVWEHLFALINCPFLALSATMQNPTAFSEWLQSKLDQQDRNRTKNRDSLLQRKQPSEINSISVLKLIQYNQRYSDLTFHHYDGESFDDIHPCCLLTAEKIRSKGFPADFHLQSNHLVELYDSLAETHPLLSSNLQSELVALHYDNVQDFKTGRQLLKAHVRKWQIDMQSFITNMIGDGHGALVNKVFQSLRLNSNIKPNFIADHMFAILCKLRDKNLLPVIVFSFDRKLCEVLAQRVALALSESQRCMPYDESRQFENGQLKVNSEFTFSEKSSIQELLTLTKDYSLTTEQIECFQRGIGVHHGGLDTKDKYLVERLFRIKAIQVVFATSTLALGINMPCKTVILAKDSIYLNPLTFRQTSGRAGRRGYDKQGNVLFYGISKSKLARLVTSDLPSITSNFPVSVSLVLRSFMLYNDSKDQMDAARKVKSLFSQPLSSGFNVQQVEILFRFAMEYLMEESMLDNLGSPLGIAGLAAHLYWAEPANLLLTSLIQRSVFHTICQDHSLSQEQKQKTLLIVLSNIFNPLKLHRSFNTNNAQNSTSNVVLESPPDFVIKAIEQHNKAVSTMFFQYCNSVLRDKQEDPWQELPLSRVKYSVNAGGNEPKHSFFKNICNKNRVTNPFAALSGRGDDCSFRSIRAQVLSVSKEIPIDQGMLPHFKYSPQTRLNRYILDFFEHGKMKLLVTANGLRPGDDYELTKTFSLLLQSIYFALESIAPPRDMFRVQMKILMDAFNKKFRREAQEREIRL